MFRRLLGLAVLILSALICAPAFAPAALAAGDVVVLGDEGRSVAPGDTGLAEFHLDVPTDALTAATFVATLGPDLTATGTATFDGQAVTAQVVGRRVTIVLPTPVTPDGHTLDVGVRLALSATRTVQISGALAYTDAGGPATATARPNASVTPDLQDIGFLTPDLNPDPVLLKGDNHGAVELVVADQRSNASGAVVTLTPSAGFSISATPTTGNDARRLSCGRQGASVVCTLSRTAVRGRSIGVDVALAAGATATTGTFTATVAPLDGSSDAVPANNTRSLRLRHTGTADLAVVLDHGNALILPNGTTTYRVTIRNDGPDAATDVQARLLLLFNEHFTASFAGTGVSFTPGANYANWRIGRLAPGAEVSATATFSSNAGVGSFATFEVGYDSTSFDPTYCVDRSCDAAAYRRITVVSTLPSTDATGGATGPQLADTGSPSAPLTGLGLTLLVIGGLASYAGRRRLS